VPAAPRFMGRTGSKPAPRLLRTVERLHGRSFPLLRTTERLAVGARDRAPHPPGLGALVPLFEQQSGYRVKTISVGTGAALALGARGEADVVLVHAPRAEMDWMAKGNGTERRPVMHNDFVVVGPAADPARIADAPDALEAFKRIADSQVSFVSRGDSSGTHQLELDLWRQAGLKPKGTPWYVESGIGMGQTLTGAEQLLGRGNLIFQASGQPPIRLQGYRA
jgi:hypothetical protein